MNKRKSYACVIVMNKLQIIRFCHSERQRGISGFKVLRYFTYAQDDKLSAVNSNTAIEKFAKKY